MPRDVAAFAARRYDLLVVGGGIHGLFAAYDAALRGLSVGLIERADFGSGLSFNHQRTIHGGLRALERGNLRKARRQIHERRTWARIAPHLLRPLPFLVGTYRWSPRSRWIVRAGFAAYDFVGRRRNADVSPELHLPKAKLESAAATRRLFPGVRDLGLTGGAVWYDYQTVHPDRLTWSVAVAAERAGATLVNYAEALGPLKTDARIHGARIRDELSGHEYDVEAAVTVLAAGSRLGPLESAFGVAGAPPLLRAMNALLDRPARDIATVAASPSRRMLTAVPWRGCLLVGTHQSDGPVKADETGPPSAAVDALIADVNATFSTLHATRADIRMLHYGLVPARVRDGRADLLSEARVAPHGARGAPGVISMVGVKYTTARATAERTIDAVCAELSRRRTRCRTAALPLPHADIADVEGRLVECLRQLGVTLDRDVADHLAGWYATEASDVLRFAASAGLLSRVSPGLPVLDGEIAYAATALRAVHLADAVLRRTPLGSAGSPGPEAIARAASVMGDQLGWTPERRQAEGQAVDAAYRLPTAP
jgi:glycerol-3-phosphate dehydrogenase